MQPENRLPRGVTGILLALLLTPGLAAQEGDFLDELLEETRELAQPAAVDFSRHVSRTPSNEFVITREEIDAVNPKHPAEMLRFVPGFVVLRRQEMAYEISAFGLGGDFSNKVLILLDGHRITSPNFGEEAWNLTPIVPDEIDRIEVTLGPESTLHGSSAFAAVVNFVTQSVRRDSSRFVLRSGTASFHQANLVSSHKTERGGTRMTFSSEYRDSTGPLMQVATGQIDPTFPVGGRTDRMLFRVDHDVDLDQSTRLRLSLGLTNSQGAGILPKAPVQGGPSEDREHGVLATLDLEHNLSPSRSLSFKTTFLRHEQGLGQAPHGVFGDPETEELSRQLELDLRYRWEPGQWKLTLGGNSRSFGIAGPYVLAMDSVANRAVFVHGEREFGEKWVLFLGARRLFQELAEDLTAWKTAALYRPRPDLGFRLSLGTSFRAPDHVGLTLQPRNQVFLGPVPTPLSASPFLPSPNLRSERAKGYLQFGVEKFWKRQRLKVDFYRTHHLDLIQPASPTGVTAFAGAIPFLRQIQYRNSPVDQVVRGVTVAFDQDLPADFQLRLSLNAQAMDNPALGVDNTWAPPRSGSLLLYRPAEGKRLGGSLSFTSVGGYGVSATGSIGGYSMVDLNLERALSSRTRLACTVRNLLDKDHYEVANSLLGGATVDRALLWGREAYLTVKVDL